MCFLELLINNIPTLVRPPAPWTKQYSVVLIESETVARALDGSLEVYLDFLFGISVPDL